MSVPSEGVDELLEADEAFGGDSLDDAFFAWAQVRIAGDRAPLDVDDLVGEGAATFDLVRRSVDLDAVFRPPTQAAEVRVVWVGDREVWIAVPEVPLRMPSGHSGHSVVCHRQLQYCHSAHEFCVDVGSGSGGSRFGRPVNIIGQSGRSLAEAL